MEKNAQNILVFFLDGGSYALDLSAVVRVTRMAEIRPLPEAPAIVLGLIDVEGQLTPVLDIRRRFRLPPKSPSPQDQLIIAKTRERQVALIVDSVLGLKPVVKTQITSAENIFPGLEYVRGVARVAGHDEMILIHDLTKFLSETEEIDLDRALAGSPAP